jgi:sulfatase-like protein
VPAAIALPLEPARTAAPRDLRAFLTWLGCWIVLPNLPFLPVTLMGGPPRWQEVAACGVVGLAVHRWSYWLKLTAYLGLMTYLTVTFIAHMFNMGPEMIMSVIGLVFDMDLLASPEYIAGAALLIGSLGGAAVLLRQDSRFEGWKWALAAAAVTAAYSAADLAFSADTMGSYTRIAPQGAPFTSATSQSHLAALADGKANVMVILVEAMGEPRDPALRARQLAMWNRPELAGRFTMTHGETTYFGSTTSGEVRELCGRWGNYPEIAKADPTCLPAMLKARGYQTRSYHGFRPDFFERDRWYPLIGIERSTFGPDLIHRGAGVCHHVFTGACDRDIPALIGADLAKAKGPQFTYWVTLNSHLPTVANHDLATDHCENYDAKLNAELPLVCRLFTIWDQAAAALAKTISRPDFPPTDILIVGDHMPPFSQQNSRLAFEPDRVTWILLRDKRLQSPERPAR